MDWLDGVEFWLSMPNTPVATLELQVAQSMRMKIRKPQRRRISAVSTCQLPMIPTPAPTVTTIEALLSSMPAQEQEILMAWHHQQMRHLFRMLPPAKRLAAMTTIGPSTSGT